MTFLDASVRPNNSMHADTPPRKNMMSLKGHQLTTYLRFTREECGEFHYVISRIDVGN